MCERSAGKRRSKLGGKDPAYVRPDADIGYTVAELVDGEEHSMISLAATLSYVLQARSTTLARVAAGSRWGTVELLDSRGMILTGHNSVSMFTSLYTTHSLVNSWK